MLTVEQAAEYLQVGRTKIYDLTHQDGFPALRLGSRIVIPKDLFLEWINDKALKH